MVQSRELVPEGIPETVVPGFVAFPKTTGPPLEMLQIPDPIRGAFAAIGNEVTAQACISGPALEIVGKSSIIIFTWSLDAGQGAFVTSQESVCVPGVNELIREELAGGF